MDDEDTLEGTGLGEELDILPSLILDPITTPDPVEIEDSADFNRVRVEWMAPLDGDISVDNESILLTGLEKATKYSLQVASVAASGVGMQSQIVNCSTMEDLPEAPSDVKSFSVSNQSVLIA